MTDNMNTIITLILISIMVLLFTQLSNAQVTNSKPDSTSTNIYFGCDVTSTLVHCDRSHNKLESFRIQSNSTTLYNSQAKPVFVHGKEGSALQMYANHRKSIIFSNTTGVSPSHFSIAFWIKCTNLLDNTNSPDTGHIVSQYNEQGTSGWSFNALHLQNIKNESLNFVIYNDKGQAFSAPDVPIFRKDAFVHIVGTFDGSSLKVYRDGSFFGETELKGTYNNHIKFPLTLGVSSSRPLQFFGTGSIDDLRYYDRAVTAEEIKQIYSKGTHSDKLISNGLIGHWKFDGNLEDDSGNNLHGMERTLISSMAFAPDGRLFFSEKDTGYIRVMKNEKVDSKPFVSITDFYSNWEQGLLGLAIDPDFENNHFIYLFYTSDNQKGNPFNRIVRFTDIENEGRNKVVLLDNIPASKGYHSGGAMAFGPDNKLYVTIGDATQNTGCGNMPGSPGGICPAQDPSSLLGKVLRINRDGSIPKDNPFPNSPVFNIGHLNMYGIAFDDDGFGLVSENGRFLFDEINTVEKGLNYGSPTIQYPDSNPEISSNSSKPLRTYYDTKCLTSMIFYKGDKIPLLNGKFLVGTFKSSSPIYALQLDNKYKKIVGELAIYLNNSLNNQVVSLAQAPNGDLYYASYEINKLNSVDDTNRIQTFFPIEFRSSASPMNVTNVAFVPSKNEIRIEVNNSINRNDLIENSDFNINPSSGNLRVTIPNTLITHIDNVTTTFGDSNHIKYDVDSITVHDNTNVNQTTLDIPFKESGFYSLQVLGNSYNN